MITISEYTRWRQPDLFWLFAEYGLSEEPMSRDALELKRRIRENHVFTWWRRLMETPYYVHRKANPEGGRTGGGE